MDVGAALDFVLRRAVLRNDDAIIEAYRDIYQARKSHAGKDIRAALRLGLLLGAELNRNQTVEKAPKVSNPQASLKIAHNRRPPNPISKSVEGSGSVEAVVESESLVSPKSLRNESVEDVSVVARVGTVEVPSEFSGVFSGKPVCELRNEA
jgi:hypothetical protein